MWLHESEWGSGNWGLGTMLQPGRVFVVSGMFHVYAIEGCISISRVFWFIYDGDVVPERRFYSGHLDPRYYYLGRGTMNPFVLLYIKKKKNHQSLWIFFSIGIWNLICSMRGARSIK